MSSDSVLNPSRHLKQFGFSHIVTAVPTAAGQNLTLPLRKSWELISKKDPPATEPSRARYVEGSSWKLTGSLRNFHTTTGRPFVHPLHQENQPDLDLFLGERLGYNWIDFGASFIILVVWNRQASTSQCGESKNGGAGFFVLRLYFD